MCVVIPTAGGKAKAISEDIKKMEKTGRKIKINQKGGVLDAI